MHGVCRGTRCATQRNKFEREVTRVDQRKQTDLNRDIHTTDIAEPSVTRASADGTPMRERYMPESVRPEGEVTATVGDVDDVETPHESHATTGGAAAAGAVTGGVIGLTGGPIGAAIGAVGGAIVGAAAERMMHSDDDRDIEPVAETEADVTYRETRTDRTDRP
jgi:hypothetical protein